MFLVIFGCSTLLNTVARICAFSFYIAFISLKYAIYGVTKPSVWCNQSFGLFKTNALFGINQPSVPFKGTETGFLESRIRAGLSFFSVGL